MIKKRDFEIMKTILIIKKIIDINILKDIKTENCK